MAYGHELFLGFVQPEMDDVLEQLGLTIDWDNEDGDLIQPVKTLNEIDKKLIQAWADCLKDRGYKVYFKGKDKHFALLTKGDHAVEAVSWDLEFAYDPHEMGDTKDQAVFGISLVSRYFPTFLDLNKPHGGSGDMICLDDANMKLIEIARKAIMTVLPQWEIAHICFKAIHY